MPFRKMQYFTSGNRILLDVVLYHRHCDAIETHSPILLMLVGTDVETLSGEPMAFKYFLDCLLCIIIISLVSINSQVLFFNKYYFEAKPDKTFIFTTNNKSSAYLEFSPSVIAVHWVQGKEDCKYPS